ncbi:alcohol dehydrogenase-like 2 isoform X1 [Juglans microcarpa x Juglans regia]|uniref:alcohol dehydrogenase-like 2 isoform X1 n=1 Tax=Juglans microcarpa x Juglans regia TaxID=2249226 RepID=UPI001B7D942E|nr:alcohol dehydrogenase-like 2 isoform X1 [Juglans microcarpa x Juglans regia]
MESHCTPETAGKVIRCKAAVCRKPGEPLMIEEIEVDPPKAWEVRIKIICTSLCHRDLTFWKMKAPIGVFPRIFGHEAVGVVESVGEHVEELIKGDIVLPVFQPNCRKCRDCMSEKSNACSVFGKNISTDMPRDRTSRFKDLKGEVLHHFVGVSSFSEYTVVDETHAVKITPDIPVDKACLLSCGVSTGVGSAWKVAAVEEGSTVAIFGLGAVGLAVAVGARLRGASKIIGVDLNPEKFEIGKKFGVTDFVNPATCTAEKPVSEVIKEMTDGGADYCFECIGLASIMQDAFKSSREGWGKTVIIGVEMHGSPLTISPYELLRGKSVIGSFFGGLKPKSDIPLLIKKYLDKELSLDEFITHELSFQEINKAFELLQAGKSLRCMIWMNR